LSAGPRAGGIESMVRAYCAQGVTPGFNGEGLLVGKRATMTWRLFSHWLSMQSGIEIKTNKY
jgi:hypothetical protein